MSLSIEKILSEYLLNGRKNCDCTITYQIPEESSLVFTSSENDRFYCSSSNDATVGSIQQLSIDLSNFVKYNNSSNTFIDSNKSNIYQIKIDNNVCYLVPGKSLKNCLYGLKALDNEQIRLKKMFANFYSCLPDVTHLLAILPETIRGSIINTLLQNGGLTTDMLLGLITAYHDYKDIILSAVSKNIRHDIEYITQIQPAASSDWIEECAILLRWNLLKIIFDQKYMYPQLYFLQKIYLLLNNMICQNVLNDMTFPEWFFQQSEKQTLLQRISYSSIILVLSNYPMECSTILQGFKSKKQIDRIQIDVNNAQKTYSEYEKRTALFHMIKEGVTLEGERNPFLKRDIYHFLNRNQFPGSRLYLLLESGIPDVMEALKGYGSDIQECFMKPMDPKEKRLLKKILNDEIHLKGTGFNNSSWIAMDHIAKQWKAIDLLGIW